MGQSASWQWMNDRASIENLSEAPVVAENVRSQKRGPIFAFMICLVALISGFTLIATGKSAYGLASIISSLAALAGVFVHGKYQQRKERQEKASALASARRR
jgi:uncharacterized membrane protein